MGFYTGNRFEFVDDSVPDFMEFPYLFDPVVKERGLPFEFLSERTFVS